jgi:hypothetical protein
MTTARAFPASRLFAAALAALMLGCMTTDPVTGEEKIDPLPTAAAVAGAAAVGALVWTATDDDDDDDDDRYYRGGRRGRGYRPFSPDNGVVCYPDQQRCYNEDGYAKKWTRRVFGD